MQEPLFKQREVGNVDVVTPQLVIMVLELTVQQVLLPEVTEELIDISKLRLQLYTSGCSAALNFSGPQIDGATMERTVFLIMSSARRRRDGEKSPVANFERCTASRVAARFFRALFPMRCASSGAGGFLVVFSRAGVSGCLGVALWVCVFVRVRCVCVPVVPLAGPWWPVSASFCGAGAVVAVLFPGVFSGISQDTWAIRRVRDSSASVSEVLAAESSANLSSEG